MLKNYLKTALRNLRKYKVNTIINILGLAIGMAVSLLIVLHVYDELTYDAYHQDADRIFRIGLQVNDEMGEARFARSSAAIATTLRKECPAVAQVTSFYELWGVVVKTSAGDLFYEKGTVHRADPDFFNFFTIPLVAGNSQTVLSSPANVVLSEATALKYFGKMNPIGQSLFFNANPRAEGEPGQWTVVGVFQDIPHNTHLPDFKVIIPFEQDREFKEEAWGLSQEATYIKTFRKIDRTDLEQQINHLAGQYNAPLLKQRNATHYYFLQPLGDIYLNANLRWEYAKTGNRVEIIIYAVIAALIFGIAGLNFINLATAQSSIRAKEIGVRKVFGACRANLIRQFITESLLLVVLAYLMALFLVELLLPWFNTFWGKSLDTNFLTNPVFALISVVLILFIGLIASGYPAFFLSAFQPTSILKGQMSFLLTTKALSTGRQSNKTLRNILVVCQFVTSVVLIIGSVIIYRQIHYMKNKVVGFQKEQMLVIPTQSQQMSTILKNDFELLKSEFLQHPTVVAVTCQITAPGRIDRGDKIKLLDIPNREEKQAFIEFIDSDYLNTYQIPLVAGRNFQKGRTADVGQTFLINETAAKTLGFTSPAAALHRRLACMFWSGEIIGVVQDFHFHSLHRPIEPLVYLIPPQFWPEAITLRLNSSNLTETLNFLSTKWKAFFPNNPFNYYFIADDFNQMYRAEEKFETLLFILTGLAIFIACLGLFGLTLFTTERRTKEIGIRKVLGASTVRLSLILSKDLTKWVLCANLFAWPVAYYLMNQWLQNFAYRIELELWLFLVSGLFAFGLAFLTVSYHTIRAALSNPVDVLRYE